MAWRRRGQEDLRRAGGVSEIDPDSLDRLVKLEMDSGRAKTREEAEAIVRGYVLQVDVGAALSRAEERILLTILNAGPRAFQGGVFVRAAGNPRLLTRWGLGMNFDQAIVFYGCKLVTELTDEHPTIVIATQMNSAAGSGALVIRPTWDGWVGGAVEHDTDRLAERGNFTPSHILAGGLCVSEAFQHARGDRMAGHRKVGLSLWRPGLDWRGPAAVGELDEIYLPTRMWLAGLGHLGQAYAWAIGALPYPDTGAVELMLQDYDVAKPANMATSLLTSSDDLGRMKTRIVADRLEQLGFRTKISERAFGQTTSPGFGEPRWLLAGFDNPEARQQLGADRFGLIVDCGLGRGTTGYLDIQLHSFPAVRPPAQAFATQGATVETPAEVNEPAYQDVLRREIEAGKTKEQVECGVLEIAGRTVGASFVGAVAACVAISEMIRALTDENGRRYTVIDLGLKSPRYVELHPIPPELPPVDNAGSVRALS